MTGQPEWPRKFGEKYPWGDTIPWPPEADLDYDPMDYQLSVFVANEADRDDIIERL